MKISSIICIIVSIFLIFVGIFVCSYARKLAPNDEAIDGAKFVDGQSKSEMNFNDQYVSKISLDLSDCNIVIHGNAESSYVKLINFQPNKYISTVSNKSVNISNNISITDFINFKDSGISFSGVWKTLRSLLLSEKSGKKKVEIYISNEEEIKNISLTISKSTLKLIDFDQESDITIKAVDSLVEINSISSSTLSADLQTSTLSILSGTFQSLSITSDKNDIETRQITSENLNIEADVGNVNVFESNIKNISVEIKDGNFLLNNDYSFYNYSKNIVSEEGTLYINEIEYGNQYVDISENQPCEINIKINQGNINLTFGNTMIEIEPTE